MLSSIAQICDHLGLLSPCTIEAKIPLQRLWLEKLTWDESLPQDIHSLWIVLSNELYVLNVLGIPRKVLRPKVSCIGRRVYIRSIGGLGNISVNLLCAITKVASIKRTSILRLELYGALVSVRLAHKDRNKVGPIIGLIQLLFLVG